MGKTSIAWTDYTFNPWHGCTKVSPGCDFCYAEVVDTRWGGAPHWGTGAPRRTFGADHWRSPISWNAAAQRAGEIKRVFTLSMGDYNDPEAPASERERLHGVINATPYLLWLILTKRPHLFERNLPAIGFEFDNVMLGATMENQFYGDQRIKPLMHASFALGERSAQKRGRYRRVRTFASYEPAIGPLSMGEWHYRPDQLIFGGETGNGRRPMEQAWAEQAKRECEEFRVAFFMKQMSAQTPAAAAGLIPAELLIRQFPEASNAHE